MENAFASVLPGIFYLAVFFALSIGLVVLGKIVYLKYFYKEKTPPPEPPKKKRKRAKVTNIVINPNEINRIYVKKDGD